MARNIDFSMYVGDLFPDTFTPWKAAFQDINRRQRLNFEQVKQLGDAYDADPWPCVENLMLVADSVGISFDTAFEWFSARRAQSIGLPPGQYVTKLPRDCSQDRASWRMVAAEFGDDECRAREIHRAQYETTVFAACLNNDESFRDVMPEVENPSERGDRRLSHRFVQITCDQLLKFQSGTVTGDQPLEYEFSDLCPRPRYIIPVDPPQYPNNHNVIARSSSKRRSDPEIVDMGAYRMQGDIILVD